MTTVCLDMDKQREVLERDMKTFGTCSQGEEKRLELVASHVLSMMVTMLESHKALQEVEGLDSARIVLFYIA